MTIIAPKGPGVARMLVQCQLRSGDKIMVTWLDTKKPLKVGNQITLKDQDDGRLWAVESIGQLTPGKNIHREWNNNI